MIDAMRAIHADGEGIAFLCLVRNLSIYDADLVPQGVAFCEAHEDLEVFRLRFGKAINFEYMEDSQVQRSFLFTYHNSILRPMEDWAFSTT